MRETATAKTDSCRRLFSLYAAGRPNLCRWSAALEIVFWNKNPSAWERSPPADTKPGEKSQRLEYTPGPVQKNNCFCLHFQTAAARAANTPKGPKSVQEIVSPISRTAAAGTYSTKSPGWQSNRAQSVSMVFHDTSSPCLICWRYDCPISFCSRIFVDE